MAAIVGRAITAAGGVFLFDPVIFDYAGKCATLYRMLVPKLDIELATEFRNSAPDNGFELWSLSIGR